MYSNEDYSIVRYTREVFLTNDALARILIVGDWHECIGLTLSFWNLARRLLPQTRLRIWRIGAIARGKKVDACNSLTHFMLGGLPLVGQIHNPLPCSISVKYKNKRMTTSVLSYGFPLLKTALRPPDTPPLPGQSLIELLQYSDILYISIF